MHLYTIYNNLFYRLDIVILLPQLIYKLYISRAVATAANCTMWCTALLWPMPPSERSS